MDYSEIKTLEQAIQVIKELEKLVRKQHDYIVELEDNSNTAITELHNIQKDVSTLEKEISRVNEIFDIIGLPAYRIFTMSVYDAMRLDDFMKGF